MQPDTNFQHRGEGKYFLFQTVSPDEIQRERAVLGKSDNFSNIVFGISKNGQKMPLRLEMEIHGNTEEDVTAKAKEIAKGFPKGEVGVAMVKVVKTKEEIRYLLEKIIPLSESGWS